MVLLLLLLLLVVLIGLAVVLGVREAGAGVSCRRRYNSGFPLNYWLLKVLVVEARCAAAGATCAGGTPIAAAGVDDWCWECVDLELE